MATSERVLSGWRAVALENDLLRVVILPEKGADIVELTDKESGVDPLFKAPWGLRPPGSVPREGWEGHEFLANYEGGWQELFPNANDPADYRGETIPFHGEVATLPWDCREEGAVLRLTVRCRQTPFRLERLMRLEGRQLVLEERVTNESEEPAHFVWGHHCVVGPPFLEAGCRLRVPAGTLETIPELWEESPRPRSPQPRRRLSHRPRRRIGGGPEPEARARVSPRLGSAGLSLGDLVAALRRRGSDAAPRLLRARH
ncbi:MAG: DUF4432 family protein [Actinobacteria bacterium]|nr:MAG: DUF4432 family protein [Actinomycetota bacterium]